MSNDNKIYVWQNNRDLRERVKDGIMVEDSDRRQKDDPNYKGPERRSGEDRRSVKDEKNDNGAFCHALPHVEYSFRYTGPTGR